MYTKTKKLLSTLLALALMLSLFAAMPMTAGASIGSSLSKAQLLAMQINFFDHGGDAGSTLYASASGNTVTVGGTVTNARNTLELNIIAGETVVWKADYSGDCGVLLRLSGAGTFEVPVGGSISGSNSSYNIFLAASSTLDVIVSGGTVRNTANGYGIGGSVHEGNNNIIVSGGTIETVGYSAIWVKGNVTVSGGAISNHDCGFAICVDDPSNIVTVSGGIISTAGGCAIDSFKSEAASSITGNSFVFAYAATITGNNVNNVICGTATIGGNAVVCGWDTSGTHTYVEGSSTDLDTNSEASAKWGIQGGETGILYSKGGNTGFFPISDVTVNPSAPTVPPAITGPTTITLQEGYAATSLAVFTVTGTPEPTVEVTTHLPAVTWNNSTKKLDIAAGLSPGIYTVMLVARSGANTALHQFELEVAPALPSTGGSMDNFNPPVNTYTRGMFTDVDETKWYGLDQQGVVATAYEHGLMTGNSATTFNPTGNMTIAEAITIATRVHCYYMTGQKLEFTPTSPWYQGNVDYAIAKGIIEGTDFTTYTRAITRAEMAYIFSRCLPIQEFARINTVNSLPDVKPGYNPSTGQPYTPHYHQIITLYEAGVVGGSDAAGTFNPNNNIIRAEAAAIISRVILPGERIDSRTYG